MIKQIKKQLRCLLAVILVVSQMVTMAAAITITFDGNVPGTAPDDATVEWNLDAGYDGTIANNTYTVSTESKYGYNILEVENVPTAPTLVGYEFNDWSPTLDSSTTTYDGDADASGHPYYGFSNSTTTYLAIWEANQYSVTLVGNGGMFDGDVSETTKEITQDYNSVITDIPTREGYDFTGWYEDDVDDNTTPSESIDKVTNIPVVDDALTLYAGWKIQTYDVTFETADGVTYTVGTEEVTASTATYGEAFTFEVSSTGGTTITGVYYTVNGGEPTLAVSDSESYTIPSSDVTDDINIFVTTNSLFSVQFQTAIGEGNGSISGTTFFIVKKDEYLGSSAYATLIVTPDTGYELTGWTTDTTSTSTVSDPTAVTVIADITYTAVFDPIDYTITYNLNEGTNYEGVPTSYTIEDTITLGTPTKTGYDFGGWYNGASKVETINEQTGALTLTAKWTATEYGIIYNLDGGTNDSKNPTIYTIEDEITLEDPTKEGYDFDGWYTDATCQTAQGTTIDVGTTGAVTLYAKWTANTYDLTFDADDGTVAEDSPVELIEMTVTYDSPIGTLPVVTKDGYTFAGWYIGTKEISAGDDWTYATGKEATAKWTANTYTLTFNADDGTVTPASKAVTYDSVIGDLPTPSKEGYEFDSWKIDTEEISADDDWTYTENKTATAQWIANEYDVTFTETTGVEFTDVGGLDDTDGYTATHDQTEDITFEISLTDVAVNFVTYKVGTAAAVEIEPVDGIYTVPASAITGVIVISANVTGLHVVTFEAGENGTLNDDETNISYSVRDGEEPDTIPTPTPNAGYEFKEWQNAGVAVDFENANVTSTTDTTFTAVFEAIDYTVSYVMNDEDADPVADGTVHYGETLPLPEDPVYSDSESDYHFNGWVVVVEGEDGKETKAVTAATVIGTDIIASDIIDSEIIVYATWKTISIDISIDIDVNVDVDVDVSAGSSDEDVAEVATEMAAIEAFSSTLDDPSEHFAFFTIDLMSTVITMEVDSEGNATTVEDKVPVYEITGPEGYLAPIGVLVDFDLEGKENLKLYRYHDENNSSAAVNPDATHTGTSEGNVTLFEEVYERQEATDDSYYNFPIYGFSAATVYFSDETLTNEDTETEGNVAIYSGKFSTFAIGYDDVKSSGGTSYYNSTLADTTDGSASLSSTKNALNSKVTVTTNPDEGYEVGDVTVTYSSGREVTVTDNGDGTYSYLQPGAAVTVTVTFISTDAEETTGDGASLNRDDHNAYIQGYDDGTFRPNSYITRVQTTVIFSRLITDVMDMDTAYANSFSDVPSSAWYADAIGFMEDYGIVNGFSDGTFRGDNYITRAQFAAIVSRFDDLTLSDENIFSDVADDYWAVDYINSAVANGWITGYSDGTFRPDDYITRAAAVTLINRVLIRYADADYVDENLDTLTTYVDVAPDFWAYYNILEASNKHDYEREDDGVSETWTSH